MEFLKYTKDMFGQKLLVGANLELVWLPFVAAGAIIVLHLIARQVRKPAGQNNHKD